MKQLAGHITKEWLDAWEKGQLNDTQQQDMLKHIGSCSYCADQFAAFLEEDLMKPPAYLREEILERSRKPDIRVVKTVYQTSRRMRFFLYSLKVGAAVAVSLFLLFFSPVERIEMSAIEKLSERSESAITEKLNEGNDKINSFLNQFTENLMHIEYKEENND